MNLHNFASPMVKILVVDDYPNTASLLARSLSRLDDSVVVISATSTRQALECFQNGAVHIVITDMDMPEMTGLELIQKLHEHPAGGQIVSFLVTAYYTQDVKIKARELHVREVFQKPVHPERICEGVRRVLEEMQEELP